MEARDGDLVQIGALQLRFKVDEANLVAFEFIVPASARVPAPHYHREVDEVIYGLEGTITTTIDGETHQLNAGDALFIPRGKVHHHQNLHPQTARALTVLTPGSIGRRYFEEMAEVLNGPGKPDLAKVKETMLRHGLVPA
ncbi:MAG TPA: cupin domain-containing protein [Hyphomicrobiaceae bacterium]|nr:cupin domain-containing protein [Hyphomicrobiaceae bacterium]